VKLFLSQKMFGRVQIHTTVQKWNWYVYSASMH